MNDKPNDVQIVEAPKRVDAPALDVLSRAEIDVQIATARAYPRSIKQSQSRAISLATLDDDTAAACGFSMPRKDKDGKIKHITGPSVRMAEIFAHAWGNLRCASRIVDETDTYVTAQGVAHDLETNVAISREVRAGIMSRPDKNGKRHRYSADMVNMTANATAAKAFRNAVFAVVPRAYWLPVYQKAMEVSGGDISTLAQTRSHMIGAFKSTHGLEASELCILVDKPSVEDMTVDDVATLRSVWTALDDGETTVARLRAVITPENDKGTKPKTRAQALAEALKGQHAEPQTVGETQGD